MLTETLTPITPFIRLHAADDVVIARSQLVGGAAIEDFKVRGLIPAGHKVAAHDIESGDPVRRYNQIIGFAKQPIAAGEHVHTHNLGMGENKGDFARDLRHRCRREARGAAARSDVHGLSA